MFSLRVYYDASAEHAPRHACAVLNRYQRGQAERRVAEIWVLRGSTGSETTMQVLAAGEKVTARFGGMISSSDSRRPDDPEQIQRVEFNGFLLSPAPTARSGY